MKNNNKKNIVDYLINGIEEMNTIIEESGKENFDIENAKLKILANNSMTQTTKTLLQYKIVENALIKAKNNTSTAIDKLLED